MDVFTLFTLAAGLSMDAFAVSVCKGLAMGRATWKKAAVVGVWFGGFQALMPAIGYTLGMQFREKIIFIDHWIAFILLGIIGGNMIRESLNQEEESCDASIAMRDMLILAVATSIDALAVGVTFAFLNVGIIGAVLVIGVTTFCFSVAGVQIGNVFGAKYRSKAEIAGGVILILMAVKILLEHLGVI